MPRRQGALYFCFWLLAGVYAFGARRPCGPHSPHGASPKIRLPLLLILEMGIDHFHLNGCADSSNEFRTLKSHLVLDDRHIVTLGIACRRHTDRYQQHFVPVRVFVYPVRICSQSFLLVFTQQRDEVADVSETVTVGCGQG